MAKERHIMSKATCGCKNKNSRSARPLPLALGLLVAILPKCPFCALAYSSAITMCTGGTVYDHAPQWFSWVSLCLAMVVIASIALNFRSLRSYFAIFLALLGAGTLAYSELYTGQLTHYYIGSTLLLAGALLNGGLVPLMQQLKRKVIATKG